MSRRARPPRHWAQVPGSPIPLVSLLKSVQLLRMPCDRSRERRALAVLRCLDQWAPTTLGPPSVALARGLAGVPWIRAPDRWTGGEPPVVSLVDHLVKAVKYPLPPFLYPLLPGGSCQWRPTPDTVLALEVLVFVGAGNPLREAPALPRLTAREAHLLWTTDAAETVVGAVRRAQVLAAGGPEWLAPALSRTSLGQLGPDESHWARVIRWLAANVGALDPDRIGPIVDYLRSCRVMPTSISRLIREERRWHESVRPPLPGAGPLPHSGFPDLKLEDQGVIWSFGEIASGDALRAEGAAMQHCVATYHGVIASGRSSIWTMRRDGDRTLTIEVWNADRAVVQVRGVRNRRATPDEQRVIERWAESLQLTVRDRLSV